MGSIRTLQIAFKNDKKSSFIEKIYTPSRFSRGKPAFSCPPLREVGAKPPSFTSKPNNLLINFFNFNLNTKI